MTRRRVAILAVLAATQLMGVVDFSIVNVALPSIGRQFALRADQLQWVVSAYVLMQAGFLLLGGRLCDVFDTKRVFLAALAVFGVASLAGGLAPSPLWLFTARGVQGLAGAVLAPGSLSLVTAEFEAGELRNRALSVFGTMAALGFVLGVIIGGALTGFAGWRWVFFVNIPIVAAIFFGSARLLQGKPANRVSPRLDILGAVVGTGAVLAVVSGISLGSGGLPRVAVLISLAGGLFGLFIWIERSSPDALIPLAIFQSRTFTGAILIAGLTNVAGLMVPFTLTLVVQRLLGYSPQATGLIFVPAGVGAMVGGVMTGLVVQHVGLRATIVTALTILAIGGAVVLGPGLHGSAAWLMVGYGVGGIGVIGTLVACTIAATSAVDPGRMGTAGGLLNTSQFLGGAIGTALAGALDAPGTLIAYSTCLLASIAVIVVAGAISFFAFGRPTPETKMSGEPVGETA
jgi:MFS family permease